MSQAYEHRPAMVHEVVELFSAVPPGLVVDATVGGGGHAAALLRALPQLRLLGVDRDEDALAAANLSLSPWRDRVELRRSRFDQISELLDPRLHGKLSGVLFDLGASSPQMDRAERGFSYRAEARLDMRMDRSQALTAYDVVNSAPADELARMFRESGESRFSARIARAIVAARPIVTTTALADVVRDAIPAPARRRGGHPARRVFQAVRIAVNAELELLGPALDSAIDLLAPGGRCVVISYHSGEDRVVKDRFTKAATGGCTCPPGMPCVCGASPVVRLLNKRARRPSVQEIEANPRSSSARLRAVERTVGEPAGRDSDGHGPGERVA